MSPVPDYMRSGRGTVSVLPALPDPDKTPPLEGEFEAAGTRGTKDVGPEAKFERRERTPFVEGVFPDMPAETYFDIEAMSASGGKNMLRSPYHYRYFRDHSDEPTAAMEFGTAVHAGVLEPATFAERVVSVPEFNKRSKDGKAAYEAFTAQHEGKVLLDASAFDRCRRCIDAVLAHPSAAGLLNGAEIEVSAFWMDFKYRVPCKMRFDARNHGCLIDLKTTPDASADAFNRRIATFMYHMQAAHYCSGSEHVFNESPKHFIFIAVESEPPHGVAVYALPGNAILAGSHHMNLVLGRYQECMASYKWPCYPDTVETIQLPRWALQHAA